MDGCGSARLGEAGDAAGQSARHGPAWHGAARQGEARGLTEYDRKNFVKRHILAASNGWDRFPRRRRFLLPVVLLPLLLGAICWVLLLLVLWLAN